MYKEAKSLVLSLAIILLCLLPSSQQATSSYYNQMLRARPYYVAPRPDDNHPNAESYPVPPHAVSSYAAPLVAISADYETTPAAIIPPTTAAAAIPKNEETESSSIYSDHEIHKNDAAAYYNATEVISLVPEVDTTTSYDGETTFWVLETSYGDAPYEGTTHPPVYLPTYTSSI